MSVTSLILFVLLCTGLYYLVARAKASRWFWGRFGDESLVGRLLACPACSGTWIGAGVSAWHPLAPRAYATWLGLLDHLLVHAICGAVLTAIGWAIMRRALDSGNAKE